MTETANYSQQPLGKYMSVTKFDTGAERPSWVVLNSRSNAMLAKVTWYSPWRQYVLEPEFGAVFNSDCLRDLVRFLEARNA